MFKKLPSGILLLVLAVWYLVSSILCVIDRDFSEDTTDLVIVVLLIALYMNHRLLTMYRSLLKASNELIERKDDTIKVLTDGLNKISEMVNKRS